MIKIAIIYLFCWRNHIWMDLLAKLGPIKTFYLLTSTILDRPCPRYLMHSIEKECDSIPKWLKKLYPTLHWCHEWDGLVIDKYCPEFECCSCLK